ncbi:hypothetical protein [Demequina rhizosphaerae]|uniref:hypothetical protein n=1 Tax=Demequina rhizosphaerae TaxID=1638985 RepID=UPI0012E0C1A0|nr:hypothetical protein [Demequina rhizosphaerae]
MSERGRRAVRWALWAVVLAFVFAPVGTVGRCVDSDTPGASYCESGLASPLMMLMGITYPGTKTP